jgi:hypothetical protein
MMENSAGRTLGEIGFYVAVAALLILFFIKKYRQARNAEKDKTDHQP